MASAPTTFLRGSHATVAVSPTSSSEPCAVSSTPSGTGRYGASVAASCVGTADESSPDDAARRRVLVGTRSTR